MQGKHPLSKDGQKENFQMIIKQLLYQILVLKYIIIKILYTEYNYGISVGKINQLQWQKFSLEIAMDV